MTDDPGAAPDDTEDDEDPDVRFSYANERTFLAWNRTALAMVTAGLAITQLLPPFDVPGGRRLIGIPLIAIGTLVAVTSSSSGSATRATMHARATAPKSILPALVAAAVALDRGHRPGPGSRRRRRGHEVSDGSYERDAGLAAERTELAWDRSTLALFACGAAVIKGLHNVTGNEARPTMAAALLVLGGFVWLSGVPYARIRAQASRAGRRPAARGRGWASWPSARRWSAWPPW